MAFSGLDPTGGAGLAADIEAIASLGGHGLPVVTAITIRDTREVKVVSPVAAADLIGQARAVLDDIPVAAFKVGFLGSVAAIEAVHTIVLEHPDVPLVLDPAGATGVEDPLADDDQPEALTSLLLPHARIATPSLAEARALAPEADSPGAMAQQVLSYGCEYVLLTGAGAATSEVENWLYGGSRLVERFRWERLPGQFQGAGCTLTSALATLLAHGIDVCTAAHQAQQYTWTALANAWQIGHGRRIPDRLHWAGDGNGE